jgi:hypothetical protein
VQTSGRKSAEKNRIVSIAFDIGLDSKKIRKELEKAVPSYHMNFIHIVIIFLGYNKN